MSDRLNEKAGKECFGLCMDVGHMQLVMKDIRTYAPVLGSRIKCLHIHDNDGVNDSHRIPFECPGSTPLGGCVDWEDAAEGLRLCEFSATSNRCINLELKTSDLPADRSVRLSHAARAVYAAKRLATLI